MADNTETPQTPAPTQEAPQAPVQGTPTAPVPTTVASAQQTPTAPMAQEGAQPVAIKPGTPHAGLVNMIQSLALGVDAFATSAATGGRQGGVGEVQDYFAKQQQQKIQAQEAQQQESEHDLRMKTMQANLLMQQMQYQQSLMRFPIELKNSQLALQNSTIDEFTKEKQTGESMGYDMNDPTQAQEAKNRMGIGSAAQQPGAIVIPFSAKQGTGDVTQAMTSALPPGKSLTDYAIMPSYTDNQHGTGGQVTMVPNNSPLMQMPATPKQVTSSEAEVQGMITKAKALGLTDNDMFQRLSGQFSNMEKVIQNGGKPTTSQLFQMHQSVVGPLSKLIADTSDANKLAEGAAQSKSAQVDAQQKQQSQDLYKAQVPRDAQGQPTMDAVTWAARSKELATKAADLQTPQGRAEYAKTLQEITNQQYQNLSQRQNNLLQFGRDPVSGEALNLNNAPDSMLLDSRTGQPIPYKMLSALAPSMQEKNRYDFAASTLHTLDQIDALRASGKLPNGPIQGLTTNLLVKAGMASQDAQEAFNYIHLAQTATTGAHVGGRFNQDIMKSMAQLLQMNMNDSQFSGAETSIRNVMGQYAQTGGRETVGMYKSMGGAMNDAAKVHSNMKDFAHHYTSSNGDIYSDDEKNWFDASGKKVGK